MNERRGGGGGGGGQDRKKKKKTAAALREEAHADTPTPPGPKAGRTLVFPNTNADNGTVRSPTPRKDGDKRLAAMVCEGGKPEKKAMQSADSAIRDVEVKWSCIHNEKRRGHWPSCPRRTCVRRPWSLLELVACSAAVSKRGCQLASHLRRFESFAP